MEENPKETPETEEEKIGSAQHWFADNLRLIISVVIVIALGVTIYSYSQRTKESTVVFESEEPTQEQILIDEQAPSEESTSEDQEVNNQEEQGDDRGNVIDAVKEQVEAVRDERQEANTQPETTSTTTSRNVDGAIVVVAGRGDGLTHLARKALQEYLVENPDAQITVAHKIYIEDSLRKSVGYHGSVHVGTEVSFSKDMIQKTIDQSKNLSESQLDNIQTKYVPLVPSLT